MVAERLMPIFHIYRNVIMTTDWLIVCCFVKYVMIEFLDRIEDRNNNKMEYIS